MKFRVFSGKQLHNRKHLPESTKHMKLIKFRVCSGNRSGSTYAEVSSSTQTNAINKLSFIIATQHGNTNKSKIVKKQTNTNMLKLRITTPVCIELN